MEVLTAVLCDSAVDYNGKLCILGAFDTIWYARFPATRPHCALAMRFLFRDDDVGEHRFEVHFVDADGRNALPRGPLDIKIEIGEIPEPIYFVSRNFVLNLRGLPFKETAQYSFDVRIDEQIIERIPLQVLQKPPPGKPPG